MHAGSCRAGARSDLIIMPRAEGAPTLGRKTNWRPAGPRLNGTMRGGEFEFASRLAKSIIIIIVVIVERRPVVSGAGRRRETIIK